MLNKPIDRTPQRRSSVRWASIVRILGVMLLGALNLRPVLADDATGKYPAGIVYGPKAAFQISAPQDWVLDTISGGSQGVNCAIYPKGGSWAKSPVVMYAKIASPENPEKEAFIAFSANNFRKDDRQFRDRVVKKGRSVEGFKFTIKEYDRPSYPVYEKAFYAQLPNAVAYIVLTAPDVKRRQAAGEQFNFVISSFRYRPEYFTK